MEAKQTVMNPEEMQQAIINNSDVPMGQAIAKVQAEITGKIMYDEGFKAGEDKGYGSGRIDGYNEATRKAIDSFFEALQTDRKAGIREVVEWIEKYKSDTEGYFHYSFGGSDLHAKLKEWGIGER